MVTPAAGQTMADELVNLTIEGRPVSVPEGTSILEAAKQAGVLVPHYCYHPALPVAGVCRMCLVEVEKAPKLAPACVDRRWPRGRWCTSTREKALEGAQGRARDAAHQPPARLPDLRSGGRVRAAGLHVPGRPRRGPAIASTPSASIRSRTSAATSLYVPNRCILCTRCVRFMDDVAHDPVLNVSERGDRAFIGKFDGAATSTHPWAGNVVDLCPVGALLSKDFLNKARAWELDRTACVCPNCTQGCNIIIETRDNVVVRLRPRPNLDVNRYFMCDYGRLNYRWMNRGDRIEAPLVRDGRPPRRDRLGHRARPAGPAAPRRVRVGRDPRLGPGVDRVARPGAAPGGAARRSPRPSRCRWATRRRSPAFPTSRSGAERAPNLAGRRAARLHARLGRGAARAAARRGW